jgi:hypothetical protein
LCRELATARPRDSFAAVIRLQNQLINKNKMAACELATANSKDHYLLQHAVTLQNQLIKTKNKMAG